MRTTARKIWIGIGVASFVTGAPGTTNAQHGGHQAKSQAPNADATTLAPPKSGEAYLTDGGPKDTRIRIYRDIALMRGHLLVGAELVDQGAWDDALPHFLHPTEELYGAMERYIKLHKVTPFDRQLKVLAQTVKARNKSAYLQAAKVVDERLTNALSAFKRFMQGAPFTSFTARTLVEVLNVAKAEYEAAIEDAKFTKPVEYQDSRGFVLYAEQVLTSLAADFEKVDASAFADMRRIIAEMKPAWPAPIPPERPVMPVNEMAARVNAFEKRAGRFF